MPQKYRIRCVALVCFFFVAFTASAFETVPVAYLGIEHGLSNNSVTCLYQDHKGFMWFGTYDGLNRYDGYNFTVFRHRLTDSTSLPNNRITVITEDVSDRLWIGTRSGVSIYDHVGSGFSAVYYRAPKDGRLKKISTIVNALKPDEKGNMLIATDEGLLLYDQNEKLTWPVKMEETGEFTYQAASIEYGDDHRAWVYVRGKGLFLFDSQKKTLKQVSDQLKNGICLKAREPGVLWLGADDGLYRYDIRSNRFSKVFSCGNRIVSLASYDGILYLVSDGNGVLTYKNEVIAPLIAASDPHQLTSPCTYALLKDLDDRVWIATLRGGINLLDPAKNKFRVISHNPLNKNSLIDNFVTALAEEDNGNIWIGTDGSGLSCWNRATNTFAAYSFTKDLSKTRSANFLTDLCVDHKQDVWVATWGAGVSRFNKKTGELEPFTCFNTELGKEDKNMFLLFEDRQGTLWAGSCLEGGLYRFNRSARKFELYDARLKNMLAMYEDRSGQLWGGDFSSLIRINTATHQHDRYEIGFAVRSILEDRNGNFWVATEGGGLLLFDPSGGTFKRYSEAEGLSNNSIMKALEDKSGNLWMSTFNGISMFNPSTKNFINFTQSDGLQSNQFTYNAGLKLRNGEFVFGGIKGIDIFFPDSIISRQRPLTVLLTDLKIDNEKLQDGHPFIQKRSQERLEAVRIPFNKAVLSIDFVALNYSASDKIRYAYYLEGWDKNWNYVGTTRTANYTRLNHGVYTFRVKAMDEAGIWNEWQEKLVIEVLPPWYWSWWAYLLYAGIAGALVWLYNRYKAEQSRQQVEVALAKMETEKEKELNEKKLLFFTNITHEFRAPLTLIADPVKELLHHPEKRSDHSGLHLVYRNARRLLSLVDQLLLFRKADADGDKLSLEKLNFYVLCQEVFVCFSQQAKQRGISYDFQAENTSAELVCDREKMEIVLFNLLSNAIKFTPRGGAVTITLREQPGHIELLVADTGCGIDPSAGKRLFERFAPSEADPNTGRKGFGIGLHLVKLFVDAHKGTIGYQSEPGKGTEFCVSIPTDLGDASTIKLSGGFGNIAGKKPVFIEELVADLEASPMKAVPENLSVNASGTAKPAPDMPDFISEKKSILVVDDDQTIREYIGTIFNDRFLVYAAATGEEGLQVAKDRIPDVIISDVIMTGMNGVEFCEKIKTDPELGHIPVILLTATTFSDIKLKGIEIGAEDYITKPFESELLIARVDNILKNRNALQQYFLDTITLRHNKTKVSVAYRNFLDKCIGIIEKEIDNPAFNIQAFAREMGMSHSSLYEKVKSVSGLSLSAFIRFIRLRKAAMLLLSTDINITEAAYQVGFNDTKYFRTQFQKLFGMTPSAYVKKYKSSFNGEYNVTLLPE